MAFFLLAVNDENKTIFSRFQRSMILLALT